MATNISTIKVLERLNELLDEVTAINRDVLAHHIGAQKRQDGKYANDLYSYDKKNKKYVRAKGSIKQTKLI